MINAEKHKEELRTLNNINELRDWAIRKSTGTFGICYNIGCKNCMFNDNEGCTYARIKWMLSECEEPIKLSRLEYDILKYLSDNTAYLYIVRESTSNLFIYRFEPTKGTHGWNGRGYTPLTAFNKLFLFIKWEDEESTPIKDVLKNCEVIENETKWIISKY